MWALCTSFPSFWASLASVVVIDVRLAEQGPGGEAGSVWQAVKIVEEGRAA